MPALNFTIRDALEVDTATCMQLDHTYETDYVWQVSYMPESNGHRVTLRQERLPRDISLTYPITPDRLAQAQVEGGLLVATERDHETLLAYITLRYDAFNRVAVIRDLVVDRATRRVGVGSRLFGVARRWAAEKNAAFLLAEIQNKNYPAIQFVQRQGLDFSGYNDKYFPDHEIALFFTQPI